MSEEILKNKISSENLLIFDLDGTLINTDEVNFFSYKEAIQIVKNLDLTCLYSKDGRFTRENLYSVIDNLSNQEYKKIIEIKNEIYYKYLDRSALNSYILNIKIKFSQKNKTALATNSHKDRANLVLDYYKIKKFFNYRFYKDDYTNTNKFLHVINNLSLDPNLAIVFENDNNEIKKAILSGIPDKNIIKIQNQGEVYV
ncbi:MAG: hypothetical protein E6Q83_04510 [Thiothrix sp.]|nr:MAG: hypothetical protein E6Q83_04510 [Thiothrix sp.]